MADMSLGGQRPGRLTRRPPPAERYAQHTSALTPAADQRDPTLSRHPRLQIRRLKAVRTAGAFDAHGACVRMVLRSVQLRLRLSGRLPHILHVDMAKKRNTHEAQHFVPQSYMKAWNDPSAPASPTVSPFLWVFNADGSNCQKGHAKSLFTENDIYTVPAPDGGRDLYLEHGFSTLEDKFTRLRNLKFNKRIWPTEEEMVWVMMFVATARVRTQAFRDFHRKQWGGLRERLEEMQSAVHAMNARGERVNFGTPLEGSTSGRGLGIEELRQLEQFPVQMMIGSNARAIVSILMNMRIAVLCTDDPIGFVTTDDPCTWYNPQAYKLSPMYRSPGLGMKDIQVTFPISPRQFLLITHDNLAQVYFDAPIEVVNELNHRHIAHANERFISCKPDLLSTWFEKFSMPEDSWENERARKIASGEIKDF